MHCLDTALAEEFGVMCYRDRLSPSHGTMLLFGILAIVPEAAQALPLARRSLAAWRRLMSTSEGGPAREEVIYAIVDFLLRDGAP